jgi:hypothetical protein
LSGNLDVLELFSSLVSDLSDTLKVDWNFSENKKEHSIICRHISGGKGVGGYMIELTLHGHEAGDYVELS